MPLASRPLLRFLAPGAAAAAVAVVVVGSGLVAASAGSELAPRSAEQLIADVQRARVEGLSGTLSYRAELGLPEAVTGLAGGTRPGRSSSDFLSMLGGSHTLRLWYSGPDKARLALMGTLGESDIIRNGRDVWLWSSRERSAAHYTLTGAERPRPTTGTAPVTPQELAEAALDRLTPTTDVTTRQVSGVAGRAAYELVLAPKASGSLVASVHIAVDGEEKVPLRVQVYSRGEPEPAFEVGFTSVEFARPEDSQFEFDPPEGTTVEEVSADTLRLLSSQLPDVPESAPKPELVGEGWTAVVVARLPAGALAEGRPGRGSGSSAETPDAEPTSGTEREPRSVTGRRDDDRGSTARLLAALPKVSGDWGSGRLLRSRLLTVVLADDGRVAAGPVAPDLVYAALSATR